MIVKFFALAMVFLLTFTPTISLGEDGQSVAASQHSTDRNQEPSLAELLEFLGQWETDDGNWIDPTDLDWLMIPEKETKDDKKE